MIDISDGLSADLGHLCDESRSGAVLYEERLPISPDARRLARRDRRTPLDHALSDGEDYELLFTLPRLEAIRVEKAKLGKVIGEISAVDGMYLRDRKGVLREIERRGWEHRFRR
jgi:thiamine-monophosphate kinase